MKLSWTVVRPFQAIVKLSSTAGELFDAGVQVFPTRLRRSRAGQ